MAKVTDFAFSPQEKALYLSIKACKAKSGIKVRELRDCFPDMTRSRVSDVLALLRQKGAVQIVTPGYYKAL